MVYGLFFFFLYFYTQHIHTILLKFSSFFIFFFTFLRGRGQRRGDEHAWRGCLIYERSPRMRRANWMSLGMMVTRLAWMAHKLVSSNRPAPNDTDRKREAMSNKKNLSRQNVQQTWLLRRDVQGICATYQPSRTRTPLARPVWGTGR